MKALFIHDHPFIRNKKSGKLYTSGNLNSVLWERYLKHFDSVTVIGRCKTEHDTSRYQLAEKEEVTFDLFTNVSGGADYFKKRKYIEEKLIQEINRHDIIIMRFPATISVFAADYCIKNNIKYVAEVVGCSWDANWNYGGLGPKLLAPYSFYKMKKAVKNAAATIYVTEYFLQKRYPSKAQVKANASNVILTEIEDDALPKRLQKIENTSKDDIIKIGIIGNISVKYKGYDVLLKSLVNLPDKFRNRIQLEIVGGGNPSYLQQLISQFQLEKQTQIKGKLKAGREIFDFLDSLDLYIHPSKQEGLPRVVIEAMSRACPILASSVAGTPELLENNFLHAPGDDKTLTKQMQMIFDNHDQQKEMANQNFSKSKAYLFSTLEKRRELFFEKVRNTF